MKDLKSLNRVLLKLSGEALAGEKKTGFDEATVLKVALFCQLCCEMCKLCKKTQKEKDMW